MFFLLHSLTKVQHKQYNCRTDLPFVCSHARAAAHQFDNFSLGVPPHRQDRWSVCACASRGNLLPPPAHCSEHQPSPMKEETRNTLHAPHIWCFPILIQTPLPKIQAKGDCYTHLFARTFLKLSSGAQSGPRQADFALKTFLLPLFLDNAVPSCIFRCRHYIRRRC